MRLLSLEVNRFRNLKSDKITFANRINTLVGKNAQGKTSVLEAVYLLAHTRSFRESKTKEVIGWSKQEEGCEIIAEILNGEGLEKTVRYTINRQGREFFVNDNKITKASDFYGVVKVVEFTPDNIALVKGEPQKRREFLDRTISLIDKEYLEHLINYQKATKSRNIILKEASGQNAALWEKLSPWTSLVISHGKYLTKKREEFSGELSRAASAIYKKIAKEVPEMDQVELLYQSGYLNEREERSEKELFGLYLEAIAKERALKRTTIGPHRDDLLILHTEPHGAREARTSASQGQARSIALSLKLGALALIKEKTGEMPILLLDDVESELDTERVKALYQLISEELKAQTFIAAVDGAMAKSWFKNDAQNYQIKGGEISS